MATNVYDGMFILDSAVYSRNPDEAAGRINKLIENAGGEILVSRLWVDGRRLAYPIKGHKKGTYWLVYFKLNSLSLAELKRQISLDDSIIRSLFIKIDPRIVDTLVEHAKAGPAAMEAESAVNDYDRDDSDDEEDVEDSDEGDDEE